jgi:hypothetical protein
MDLNQIQLQGAQVAGLYPNTLVELAAENMPPVVPETPQERPAANEAPAVPGFLGQHGKGILLVNDDPDSVFIADNDLEVLTKIMDRAGISLADIAIVNWARIAHKDGNALQSALNSNRILLFGVSPEAFGLAAVFPHYQIQKLGGRTYLCAPPVSALARAEDAVKKTFWSAFRSWLG